MEVPRYSRRELNSWWYHQLHGHVPGAEQEKILEPAPDTELLAAPHIQTAWQFLSSLAPRLDEGIGLAFVNLSTQPQPGSGGMAVILALRTLRGSGIVDHQGREGALVRHGILAVNRLMDMLTLKDAATALVRHAIDSANLAKTVSVPTKAEFAESSRRVEGSVDSWYGTYRRNAQWGVNERKQSLLDYLRTFRTLPQLHRPRLDGQYVGSKANKLIYVEYPEATPLIDLIAYASQFAAALHLSNFADNPWSSIEIGTKLTDPVGHGITIRFVPSQLVRLDAPGARFDMHKQMPEPAQRDAILQMRKLMQEMFNATWERQPQQTGPRVPRTVLPTEEQVEGDTINVPDSAITPQLDSGAALTVVAPSEGLTIPLPDERDADQSPRRPRDSSGDLVAARPPVAMSSLDSTRVDMLRLPHETAALESVSPTSAPSTGQLWHRRLIQVALAAIVLSLFVLTYLVNDAAKGFKQLNTILEKLNVIDEGLGRLLVNVGSRPAVIGSGAVNPVRPYVGAQNTASGTPETSPSKPNHSETHKPSSKSSSNTKSTRPQELPSGSPTPASTGSATTAPKPGSLPGQ